MNKFQEDLKKKLCLNTYMLKCLNDKGFTLIEIMVVIFIITVGLLAAFNVIQNITIHSRLATSRLTAVYLAQEGIEMIRNQRDTNWLEHIDSPPVDWDENILATGSPGCSTTSVFGKFDRNCAVTSTPAEMEISVEVSWRERGRNHSITSVTELHNWLFPPLPPP